MDAATAVVPPDAPIISQIDAGGLELLTEALLEDTGASVDDAVLPLDESTAERERSRDKAPQIDTNETNDARNIEDQEDHNNLIPRPQDQSLPPVGLPEDVTDRPFLASIEANEERLTTPIFVAHSGPQPQPGGDIAAYFALEFLDMQYIYYMQRSSVSLGRSSMHSNASSTAAASTGGADIDLGPLKNISRLHARIEYEEEIGGFVLAVVGRNGAFVDGTWREPGRRVPLNDRSLIQISSRAFYFILPNSPTPSNPHLDSISPQLHGHSPEHDVPPLDYTITTADDSHSHSTSASVTPRQRATLPCATREDEDEDEIDIEPDEDGSYHPITAGGRGKGKGKGKGKEAIGVILPAKRGRGRPRKNPLPANTAPKPKAKERTTSIIFKGERDHADLQDIDMDLFLDDEDEDEKDDSGDDFVPKNVKRGTGVRGRPLGGGKSRSGTLSRPGVGTSRRPRSDSVVIKDEEMSEISGIRETPVDELEEGEAAMYDGEPGLPSEWRVAKRKRDPGDDIEDGPDEKRRKSTSNATKASKGGKTGKKTVDMEKDAKAKARKRGANKPEIKSLFTTAPAPPISALVASKADAAKVEGADSEADTKTKTNAKKSKDKKGKKCDTNDKGNGEDEGRDGIKEGDEEDKKPLGPPPPKPPFTYPLLCYRALKALNGKAPYRAITRWLEKEYPYFAFATKEGKDGWENSTRHTLSSHRAFIKIERGPEERGKGCFWSFDSEFEEQFKDQWRAAESQSRNPRPPRPPMPGPPNGQPPLYRPPYPPPPGWSGITPPHLMPGYRPPPPGPNGVPGPYPYPPPLGRGMPPGPPGMPFGGPFPPPPPGIHPPPPLVAGANATSKTRPPKKPKQALGAAFSRVPLIRPGLGGVPAKTEATSTPGKPDELVARGEYAIRMALRAAQDELAGIAPTGAATAYLSGPWMHSLKGKPPIRPAAGSRVKVAYEEPPKESLPTHPPIPPAVKSEEDPSKDNEGAKDDSKPPSPTAPPKPPSQISMPITFWDGTLYLHPRAFPGLEQEDIRRMQDMSVEAILTFLVRRYGPRLPPPLMSNSPSVPDGNKEEVAREDAKEEPAEETEVAV